MQKKIVLTLFPSILLPLFLTGQDIKPESMGLRKDPQWLQSYQGEGVLSTSLDVDEQGNVYTAGTFERYFSVEDSSFESAPWVRRESFPNTPFVQKHDALGNYQWTVTVAGQGRIHDLVVEESGSIVFCGEAWDRPLVVRSVNGNKDTVLKNKEHYHGLFVIRLSKEGDHLASMFFGEYNNASAEAIAIDSKGGLVLAGNYMYSENSYLKRNWLLARLKPNLELDWVRAADSTGRSQFLDVVLDGRDHIYTAGWYTKQLSIGYVDLNLEHDTQKGLITKWTLEGDLVWVQPALTDPTESTAQVVVNELLVDYWHRIYCVGGQFGRLYLTKLNRNGEPKWQMRCEGRSSYPFGMTWGSGGEILIYGHGYGSSFWIDSDSPLSYVSKGGTDFFLFRANRRGRIKSFMAGGGAGTDYLTDAAFYEGQIFTLGHNLGGSSIEFRKKSLPEGRPQVWLGLFNFD